MTYIVLVADTTMTVERCLWEGKNFNQAKLSCSEFCACHASQCENQWTVRESSDEEDD